MIQSFLSITDTKQGMTDDVDLLSNWRLQFVVHSVWRLRLKSSTVNHIQFTSVLSAVNEGIGRSAALNRRPLIPVAGDWVNK